MTRTRQEWAQVVYQWFETWNPRPTATAVEENIIVTLPGVFPPSPDTIFFTEVACAEIQQSISATGTCLFAEMGTGSGATSICAALLGADVCAGDRSKRSVENARLNAAIHGCDIELVHSDVFGSFPKRPNTLLYWNIPFNFTPPKDKNIGDEKYFAAFDINYKALEEFLTQAYPNYLAEDGTVLLGADREICDLDLIKSTAAKNGYIMDIYKERKLDFNLFTLSCVVLKLERM